MKRKTTKTNITVSIDIELNNILTELFNNKSEYIEWLVYQDVLEKKVDGYEKIII
jgi:hypothetical protein